MTYHFSNQKRPFAPQERVKTICGLNVESCQVLTLLFYGVTCKQCIMILNEWRSKERTRIQESSEAILDELA